MIFNIPSPEMRKWCPRKAVRHSSKIHSKSDGVSSSNNCARKPSLLDAGRTHYCAMNIAECFFICFSVNAIILRNYFEQHLFFIQQYDGLQCLSSYFCIYHLRKRCPKQSGRRYTFLNDITAPDVQCSLQFLHL